MSSSEIACPDVVITAGGTRENIDDVRYIGNFSGGRLGHELASAYAQQGKSVLLLAPDSVVDRFGPIDGVEHQSFTSAESLQDRLLSIPATDLILHAAAVADYTPVRTEGKISSDQDELTIHLKRTPKIINKLRDHFGDRTEIVGFKLLSGVDESELIAAAVKQMRLNRTNLCVANDLQELGTTRRIHVVRPDGYYRTAEGDVPEIARQIQNNVASDRFVQYVRAQ